MLVFIATLSNWKSEWFKWIWNCQVFAVNTYNTQIEQWNENESSHATPPLRRDLVKSSTRKLWHTSSFLLERYDFKNATFEKNPLSPFWDRRDQKRPHGQGAGFRVDIFTKSLLKGGVMQYYRLLCVRSHYTRQHLGFEFHLGYSKKIATM